MAKAKESKEVKKETAKVSPVETWEFSRGASPVAVFTGGKKKFALKKSTKAIEYTDKEGNKRKVNPYLCPTGDGGILSVKRNKKSGRYFYGCSKYPECFVTMPMLKAWAGRNRKEAQVRKDTQASADKVIQQAQVIEQVKTRAKEKGIELSDDAINRAVQFVEKGT